MINASEIKTFPPQSYKNAVQQKAFEVLAQLDIPFYRVENDEAITMEDCESIDTRLEAKTVKTLFLCNRQQTAFYLFVTPGDKPFRTKNFGAALKISRVSFAPGGLLQEMLGTIIGATTIFSVFRDTENRVQVVIDNDVLKNEWYACSDGTTTGYMKIPVKRLIDDILPYSNHVAKYITVSAE